MCFPTATVVSGYNNFHAARRWTGALACGFDIENGVQTLHKRRGGVGLSGTGLWWLCGCVVVLTAATWLQTYDLLRSAVLATDCL